MRPGRERKRPRTRRSHQRQTPGTRPPQPIRRTLLLASLPTAVRNSGPARRKVEGSVRRRRSERTAGTESGRPRSQRRPSARYPDASDWSDRRPVAPERSPLRPTAELELDIVAFSIDRIDVKISAQSVLCPESRPPSRYRFGIPGWYSQSSRTPRRRGGRRHPLGKRTVVRLFGRRPRSGGKRPGDPGGLQDGTLRYERETELIFRWLTSRERSPPANSGTASLGRRRVDPTEGQRALREAFRSVTRV